MSEKRPLAPEECANYGCRGCHHPDCYRCRYYKRLKRRRKPGEKGGNCRKCGSRLNMYNPTDLCALCRKEQGLDIQEDMT